MECPALYEAMRIDGVLALYAEEGAGGNQAHCGGTPLPCHLCDIEHGAVGIDDQVQYRADGAAVQERDVLYRRYGERCGADGEAGREAVCRQETQPHRQCRTREETLLAESRADAQGLQTPDFIPRHPRLRCPLREHVRGGSLRLRLPSQWQSLLAEDVKERKEMQNDPYGFHQFNG